jgi:hypothetical protein
MLASTLGLRALSVGDGTSGYATCRHEQIPLVGPGGDASGQGR